MRFAIIIAAVAVALSTAALAENPSKIVGADLYIDLAQYAGRVVILTDGGVVAADNFGALIVAAAVRFKIITDGIDPESFRFMLKNCSSIMLQSQCKFPLLVTPTGEKSANLPVLKDVKMIQ